MASVRASSRWHRGHGWLALGTALVGASCAADAGDGPKGDSVGAGDGSGSGSGGSGSSGSGTSDDASSGDTPPASKADADTRGTGNVADGASDGDGAGGAPVANDSGPPATPSCATCPLTLDYYTQDSPATAASTQTIAFDLAIGNAGSSPQALSELKVRYFFTADGGSNLTMKSYYAPGAINMQVTGTFTTLTATSTPAKTATADTYLEIGFNPVAGDIAAAGNTGDIQIAFFDSTYASHFTETNDASFTAADTKSACAATNNVITCPSMTLALYRNGTLVWGAEP